MSANYLELLPLELIFMIFENLDHDLVAHVTFSKLRPDIYEFCYKGRGPEFWKPVLRASGLSTLELSEHDHEVLTSHEWEHLARECVKHAESCKHPRCGMARLRENEELMRSSISSGVSLMRTLDSCDEDDLEFILDLYEEEKHLSFSTAMDIITFKTREYKYAVDLPAETWRSAAFIRHEPANPEDKDSLQYDDEFSNHPILWRSFFAFPPIARFRVTAADQAKTIAPHNPDGVILADVLENIVEVDRSVHMDGSDYLDMIEWSDLNKEERKHPVIIPRSWTLSNTLMALHHFRDWFKLVRWVGLNVNQVDDRNIFCNMNFKAQKLPDDYEEFDRLTTYSYIP